MSDSFDECRDKALNGLGFGGQSNEGLGGQGFGQPGLGQQQSGGLGSQGLLIRIFKKFNQPQI
jgi:hypothetical protein